MKLYARFTIYSLTVVLLAVKPFHSHGQQSIDRLKGELELKKIKQQLAEAEQKRLEAEKAAKQAKKDIDDADKPAEKTAKELAEERKAISEADAASLKAKKEMLASPFTNSSVTGSISATGTFPETSILNQESLTRILEAMINDINVSTATDPNTPKKLTLVVYNAEEFNGLASYASLLDQFERLKIAYIRTIDKTKHLLDPHKGEAPLMGAGLETVSLALTAANSIAQTVGGVVQLFRTDVSFTNGNLPVDEFNLASLMRFAIRHQQMPWTVYHPAVYPVDILKRIGGGSSQLQEKITGLDAQNVQAEAQLASVDKIIEELTTKAAPKPAGKGLKLTNDETGLLANLTNTKANLTAIQRAYTNVSTYLYTVDPTDKLTPLVTLTRMERLAGVLVQDDTYVVKMVATATGSQKVMKSTIRRARIEHSAGAVLSYEVFSPTGEVICGAGIYNYSPYQESKDIDRKSSIPQTFLPAAKAGAGKSVTEQLKATSTNK